MSPLPYDGLISVDFANADHIGAVNAIIRGLSTRVSKEAGYLIHTSGDSILKYPDIERHSFGEAATKVFDDIADIEEIRSFPDYAPHRPVEKIVFAAHESNGTTLHSAIVCPPTIVGEGRGPGNRQSIQLPLLARIALDRKRALYVGPGEAYLTSVHVSDLSNLFLRLFDAVAARPGSVTWDKEGYYFANAEEHRWGEVSKHIAMEAHQQGLIPTQDVASIPVEEANHIHSMGAELLGGNSRQIASRARKLLGWSPIGPSLVDTIPELITGEAKSLGLIRGHAAKLTRDQ